MLDEVLRQIDQRSHFLLTSHARPDGDAIGSALACGQILRLLGKRAEVVLHDPVPRIYQPLPFADRVVQADRVNGRYEAAILLECDSVQRTRLEGLENQFLINIDHHASGRPFAHVNWIDPRATATAELVYQLAKAARVKISREIATCLYTALLTDTGSFIYFAHSTAKMRLLGAALSNLHRDGPLAWIWVTREQMERTQAKEEDCEGIVNYALSIQDVEVAAFFREMADGRYRVSLRSKGQLNVAEIAERFGGGGHECASGCSLDGPLSMAVAKVMREIRPESSEA
jgi:phosphoesterase RecJ-like protein